MNIFFVAIRSLNSLLSATWSHTVWAGPGEDSPGFPISRFLVAFAIERPLCKTFVVG